eukprot:1463968-Pleurochrysis_carterae.AAC.1
MPGTSGGKPSSASKASGTKAGRARGDGGANGCGWLASAERGEGGSGVDGGEVGGDGAGSVRSMSKASDAGCECAAPSGKGRRAVGAGMK